ITVVIVFLPSSPTRRASDMALPGSSQVALSWTGFTDAGSGLATTNPYKLFSSTTDFPASCTGTPLFSGSQTSFTHSSLTNGTTYFYRLCATDNAGNRSEEHTSELQSRGHLA